jgi:chromosome segregation ATPase
MSSTTELQQELQTLQARQGELTAERDAAVAALSEAREAVVSGAGKTETLIVMQSAAGALSGAVGEVERRITAKRAEVAQAQADDVRAATVQEMAGIAATMNERVAELDGVTSEALTALSSATARTVKLIGELSGLRMNFANLSKAVGSVGPLELALELDGVPVDSANAETNWMPARLYNRIETGEHEANALTRANLILSLIAVFEQQGRLSQDDFFRRIQMQSDIVREWLTINPTVAGAHAARAGVGRV